MAVLKYELMKPLLQAIKNGAEVKLMLEVSVNAPKGMPPDTVKTVSENCHALKINFGFEDN